MKKNNQDSFYSIEGVLFPRIRYGDENIDWGAERWPCHDCGAVKGNLHDSGCDVESCPKCEQQAIGCECRYGRNNSRGIMEARQAIAELFEGP